MTIVGNGPMPSSGVYSQPRTISPPLTNSTSRLTSRRSLDAAADLGGDPFGARQERVLERGRVRHGAVARRDAPGVVEIAEALHRDARDDLAGPPPRERSFLDDDDPVRLRDRGQHRGDVERTKRPEIDDLRRDPVRG